jgi:hypothetical protein
MATRSPTNNHNYWGQYATVGDLPNVSGAATQSSTLRDGDTAYVSGTSRLYACTYAVQGAAVWVALGNDGADAELAFAWNGVDVSQFDVAAAFSSFDSEALTVQASTVTPPGNLIRLEATNLAAPAVGDTVCWLAKDPLPFVGEKRNILVEMEIIADGANTDYGGITVLGDESDVAGCHGYVATGRDSNNGWRARIDQGVQVIDAVVVGNYGNIAPGVLQQRLYADKVAAAVPRFRYTGWGRSTNLDSFTQGQDDYPSEPAPATWNPLACDRWGLSVQRAAAVGAGTTFVLINNLRVWVW